MSNFIKKQRASFYFDLLALPLMVVGLVYLIRSSTMSVTNSLGNLPVLVAAMVVGILAVLLDIWAANRPNEKGCLITLLAKMVAVAVNMGVVGSVLNARVMMFAGLFSYNANYAEGWAVFDVSKVSLACLLIAALLLIVGAFFRSVRREKQADAQ